MAMSFTGLKAPSNRSFRLFEVMVPEVERDRDDGTMKSIFDDVLQPVFNELMIRIDSFARILDPDVAPEAVVDLMLIDLGNPFPFVLTETQKRALVQTLADIYRLSGTKSGLESSILFFTGIVATVVPILASTWELGVDELDTESFLGGGQAEIYSFNIEVPAALTAFQTQAITWLAGFMRASHEHLISILVVP